MSTGACRLFDYSGGNGMGTGTDGGDRLAAEVMDYRSGLGFLRFYKELRTLFFY